MAERIVTYKGEEIPDWITTADLEEEDVIQEPVVVGQPDGTWSIILLETGPDGETYEAMRDDGWTSKDLAIHTARMMYGADVKVKTAKTFHKRLAVRAGQRGKINGENVTVIKVFPESDEVEVIYESDGRREIVSSSMIDLPQSAQDGGDLGENRNKGEAPEDGQVAVDTGRDFGGDVQLTQVTREPGNWGEITPRGAQKVEAQDEYPLQVFEVKAFEEAAKQAGQELGWDEEKVKKYLESTEGGPADPEQVKQDMLSWETLEAQAEKAVMSCRFFEGKTAEEVLDLFTKEFNIPDVDVLGKLGLTREQLSQQNPEELKERLLQAFEEEIKQKKEKPEVEAKFHLAREVLEEERTMSFDRVHNAQYLRSIGIPVAASKIAANFKPEEFDIEPEEFAKEPQEVQEVVAFVLTAKANDISPKQAFAQFVKMNGITELGDLLALAGALMDYGVEVPVGGFIVPETIQTEDGEEFLRDEEVRVLSEEAYEELQKMASKPAGVSVELILSALREADKEFAQDPFE